MSGGNVTIGQFNTTTTAPVAGDSFAAYQATASATVRFLATQVATYVIGSTTATSCATGAVDFLASSPAGFAAISINGAAFVVPYYNP